MATRIPWDEYEAAYLLSELICVLDNKISRNEAIQNVSETLRRRAIQRGIEIDDVFRNLNGITLQMNVMEYIYTEGKHGLKKKSMPQLFQRIVNMYMSDKSSFDLLLKEVIVMPRKEPIEEQFFSWLSTQVSHGMLSNLYTAFNDINYFCLDRKILKKPLFETVDLETLNKVKMTVERNSIFRFIYKKQLAKMSMGINRYIAYIKYYADLYNNGEVQSDIITSDKHSIKDDALTDKLLGLLREHGMKYVDLRSKGGCLWVVEGIDATPFIKECRRYGVVFHYKEDGGNATLGMPAWWTKDSYKEPVGLSFPLAEDGGLPDSHNSILAAMNTRVDNRQEVDDNQRSMRNDYVDTFDSSIAHLESSDSKKKYEYILSVYFGEDGYQPGRAIFRGRFKHFYSSEFGVEPSEEDEQIDDLLQKVGAMRDGRIFPKHDEEQNDLLFKITEDILAAFEEGATGIYISAVFSKYQSQLAESMQIYNMDALTPLLLAYGRGMFIQRYSCFVKEGMSADPANDILRIMQAFQEPQNYESIHQKAWYIPFDKMKTLLVLDKSIVNVASESYFYAPNLPVSALEIQHLILVIRTELEYRSHITDVELMDMIRTKCPSIAINTDGFTTYGLRNCLGYILKDHFSFNGPIISPLGKELSMSDVYAEFARTHEELSFEDLKRLSIEMNIGIYWDSILDEMVRISDQKMVRRDLIGFDVEFIDNILDGMCSGQYVSIKDINLFLQFPNIGYAWNHYVLESYLFKNSRKFKLLHVSFGQNSVCGAMVRFDSPISDYRTLVVDALSRSNALGSPQTALQYIVDRGYQQRRRYDGIEQIIQEAKLIKEQRENEEK